MKCTLISDSQAILDLSDQEIKILQCIFIEVKNILNYEPEFQTRIGGYYEEIQKLIDSLNDKLPVVMSLAEITMINAILNEACNGINIQEFDLKIGISKLEANFYLKIVNKVMNELRSFLIS
jgi:hypothetical protein